MEEVRTLQWNTIARDTAPLLVTILHILFLIPQLLSLLFTLSSSWPLESPTASWRWVWVSSLAEEQQPSPRQYPSSKVSQQSFIPLYVGKLNYSDAHRDWLGHDLHQCSWCCFIQLVYCILLPIPCCCLHPGMGLLCWRFWELHFISWRLQVILQFYPGHYLSSRIEI